VRIAIGSDHAGFHLKETIKARLVASGLDVDDVGTTSDASVDYPDFAAAVADRVVAGDSERGILVCGTGIGMAIAANKVHGIRAAAVVDESSARLCRSHNDANVLTLGARLTSPDGAMRLVRLFIDTPFSGGRHQLRLDKAAAIEARQAPSVTSR
jgi:ribose 5-phosphate isomerase B